MTVVLNELPKAVEVHDPTCHGIGRDSCLVRISPASVNSALFPLGKSPVTFGRSGSNTIELVDDYASRLHATLERDGDVYIIRDAGSLNGTYVNDERIQTRTLRSADRVRMGNHIYKFLSSDHIEVAYHEAVYQMMTLDALTQVYNRRYFEDALQREVLRSARHGRSIALIMMDVDHFKNINDKFGHLVGDEVLRTIGKRIRNRVRRDEVFARIGGEEFALVMVETDLAECIRTAEQLRQLISHQPIETAAGDLDITISLGVAHAAGLQPTDPGDLMSRADEQLFIAKRSGRDCVRPTPRPVQVRPATIKEPAQIGV